MVVKRWVAAVIVSFMFGVSALAIFLAASVGNIQKREIDRDKEWRIQSRSILYAGCQEINDTKLSTDKTYQSVIAEALVRSSSPERLSRSLDLLRNELSPSDCEHTLQGLDSKLKPEARKRAEILHSDHRLPLPPVTVPGYIPLTTTTTGD